MLYTFGHETKQGAETYNACLIDAVEEIRRANFMLENGGSAPPKETKDSSI